MKIVSVGPIVGPKTEDGSVHKSAKLLLTVEDDEGRRFRIRLFADYAYRLTQEQLRKAVRGILQLRHSPDPKFAALSGVEV